MKLYCTIKEIYYHLKDEIAIYLLWAIAIVGAQLLNLTFCWFLLKAFYCLLYNVFNFLKITKKNSVIYVLNIFGTFIFNLYGISDTKLCFKAKQIQVFNLKLNKKKILKQYCLIYEHNKYLYIIIKWFDNKFKVQIVEYNLNSK